MICGSISIHLKINYDFILWVFPLFIKKISVDHRRRIYLAMATRATREPQRGENPAIKSYLVAYNVAQMLGYIFTAIIIFTLYADSTLFNFLVVIQPKLIIKGCVNCSFSTFTINRQQSLVNISILYYLFFTH